MAPGNSTGVVDQVAKFQAHVLVLQQQITDLEATNAQLGNELEITKSELRETQAFIGQAIGKADRRSESQVPVKPLYQR